MSETNSDTSREPGENGPVAGKFPACVQSSVKITGKILQKKPAMKKTKKIS
jgi:hypothetical protein